MKYLIIYPFDPALGASGRKLDAAQSFEALHDMAGINYETVYLEDLVSVAERRQAGSIHKKLAGFLASRNSPVARTLAAVVAGLDATRKKQIDGVMIYALTSRPLVAGTVIALVKRVPFWIYDHRSYYAELIKQHKKPSWFHRFTLPRAAGVLAMSSRHKADIEATFPDIKATVLPILPFAKTAAHPAPNPRSIKTENSGLLMGAWTNWRQIKRLDVLVEAFRLFVEEKGEGHLIIAGPLPDCDANRAAKRIIGEAGLEDRVEFAGSLERPAIVQMAGKLDLAVISSQYESLGLPALEALTAGTPVVSTSCGGPEDFIKNGADGYVVPVDNPLAMAGAFTKFTDNRQNFLREEIAGRAAARFSMEEQALALAAVYGSGSTAQGPLLP